MISIEIDGQTYEVEAGGNLLASCLALGLDLPYFCWHPAMGSVGACRQCAVIQYMGPDDARGRLVMACMTPLTDGLRVSLQAARAARFRAENIELLMTHHPHDCPVCEEGGECHLQDMTVMSGHTLRRYRGLKRTHRNQYLGPFINHEMNRCIACYRCVRFYRDYAGGDDLQALGMHNNVYFGRHQDGALENEFSGNLVEVCPTGVFTDKTFSAHYARKWDLQTAPSVCAHCGLGCNTTPGERYGVLRRVVNRYHGEINGYFLCDRGRFGYDFVNSARRLRQPLLNGAPISVEAAQAHFRQMLQEAEQVIGIGSPRASLEANFALRERVGADNFVLGLEATEYALLTTIAEILAQGGIHTPSLREIEQADAALVLGEDLTQTAPRMALALRRMSRNAALARAAQLGIPPWQDGAIRALEADHRSPLSIVSPYATRLDDVATHTWRAAPDEIARLGFAVAHCLDPSAPAVEGLSEALRTQASAIAATLQHAQRPLVVAGTGCASLATVQAAFNIAKALGAEHKALAYAVPECNSLGLALMGGHLLAEGMARESLPQTRVAIVLENDLYRRAPSPAVDALLRHARVVVIDALRQGTSEQAELTLPAATWVETVGTLVNNEGRAQRYFPVYPPAGAVRASWQWLAESLPQPLWQHFDELTAACAAAVPVFARITEAAPGADFRIRGLKAPRQTPRVSGRTAMHAQLDVSEPQTPADTASALAFSMEGASQGIPPALLGGVWAAGWNSNQAVFKFQDTIGGSLQGGDPGVRLLDAAGDLPWFTPLAATAPLPEGVWRVVPRQHLFGSEELSRQAPAIAERTPTPYVALAPADATRLGVGEGDRLRLASEGMATVWQLPVRLDPTQVAGVVGVPVGWPATGLLGLSGRVRLTPLAGTPGGAPDE